MEGTVCSCQAAAAIPGIANFDDTRFYLLPVVRKGLEGLERSLQQVV